MIDFFFYSLWFIYACALAIVLFIYRREPLYDPRILFTLSSSMWLLIIHGYSSGYEGYLAAKPGFYSLDIKVLSAMAMATMLVGYVALVGGASLAIRFRIRSPSKILHNHGVLSFICLLLFFVALLNFLVNVALISGGNLIEYLSNFALRPYEVRDNQGVSAVGYLLGFIGVQMLAFVAGRRKLVKPLVFGLLVLVFIMFVIRFSQGRVFQTLVFLGACYVSYTMGTTKRKGVHTPWIGHVHYLFLAAAMGLGIYFLRLASSLRHTGVNLTWQVVQDFSSRLVHFSLERGNVPNFPVVFTIIDKMPSEVSFFYGKTLFNWAVFFIPRSILEADYLISWRIKRLWYLDVEGGGLPPTAVGEWYANFGIGGVIVGMFLVGFALGAIYKIANLSENPFLTVLWANLAFGFVVIYPKTDLAQIPVYSIFILLCLWLLMKLLEVGAGPRSSNHNLNSGSSGGIVHR